MYQFGNIMCTPPPPKKSRKFLYRNFWLSQYHKLSKKCVMTFKWVFLILLMDFSKKICRGSLKYHPLYVLINFSKQNLMLSLSYNQHYMPHKTFLFIMVLLPDNCFLYYIGGINGIEIIVLDINWDEELNYLHMQTFSNVKS